MIKLHAYCVFKLIALSQIFFHFLVTLYDCIFIYHVGCLKSGWLCVPLVVEEYGGCMGGND